jgi:nucleoside-diphosphate-sugar epimerase
MHQADFLNPAAFLPAYDPGSSQDSLWVSFAPIWLLAPFFHQLAVSHPERLLGLRGVIACSSSSVITKRFAANQSDRQLVSRLAAAEVQLSSTCRSLEIPCRILRPTLVYGQVGPYGDRNLSRLLSIMRLLPFLLLPANTGLRQPIHARQLAAVALRLARQLSATGPDPMQVECIDAGGDTELSYADMLRALQRSLPHSDPARTCRLLSLPNPLFFFLSAPLLLRSSKVFEALLRMSADLSGFTPAHQLSGEPPHPFPLLPLAR